MRLFFAVGLPVETVQIVTNVIDELSVGEVSVKWVAKQNLHFTLRFLGEVNEQLLPKLIEVGKGVAKHNAPEQITLTKLGTFPERGVPKVIWIGVQPQTLLQSLHYAIEDQLIPLGFDREDKRYTPHLTLGRVKPCSGATDLLERLSGLALPKFSPCVIDSFELMESKLTPNGPIYSEVHSFPLVGVHK